jgi:ubiquinone/menaquinone biosynthesis C-methylase UbiE
MSFYEDTIEKLVSSGIVDRSATILTVGAGRTDRDAFLKNDFIDVTITNLEYDRGVSNYEPYRWEFQDIEDLSYGDQTFDWVFVHASLHHCASPHRGLCEMLRVAKHGIGVFESKDSLLSRFSVALGLVPKFEIEPVVLSDGVRGGYRNSEIPNFVYRWTEREVIKTVNSFLPHCKHRFLFYYDYSIPLLRLSMSKSISKRLLAKIVSKALPILRFLIPGQGNQFAFVVSKEGDLHQWLKRNDGGKIVFDTEKAKKDFSPEKYPHRHESIVNCPGIRRSSRLRR